MLNKILWTVDFTPPDPPELKSYALMIRKLYEQLARAFNAMVDVVNTNIELGNIIDGGTF